MKWLTMAALVLFCTGTKAQDHPTEAFNKSMEEAMAGSVKDQYLIGQCYYFGREGVKRNYDEAAKWFRMAANEGERPAQRMMGYLYYYGRGVGKNFTTAYEWFYKAAEDDSESQRLIGEMYLNGDISGGADKAYSWIRKAVDKGDPYAMSLLGRMYINGEGVGKNQSEAFRWYKKSAESKVTNTRYISSAQYMVGYMYYHGIGVKKNKKEGKRWIRKAADNGCVEAKNFK